MKTFAILSTAVLVVGLATANMSISDAEELSRPQTLSVPDYPISFVRGSYELVKAEYDRSTQMSEEEITSTLKKAGFSGNGLKMAKAIAFHESTNRPMSLNRSSDCYGLFQINMSGSLGASRRSKYNLNSNDDLYNPFTNARIAYQMSSGGKNWSAWSTERSAKASLSR